MRILICNERFLFRFGVDRVLLMLGSNWKKAGHEIIMMGNKLDSRAVDKCSDRFIMVPEAPDYLHGNDFTLEYVENSWDEWFDNKVPDIVLIAGWPFYRCFRFMKSKCGTVVFHDYGAVPLDGMNEPQTITQNELRRLRRENLKYADRIIAISSFLEETQSKVDVRSSGKNVQTAYVHLGIDHLDASLWEKDELEITQNDVITDIQEYKNKGYKIVFQPGRWENGNYKNSSACIDVIRKLRKERIKHKILVLSEFDQMEGVSDELKDSFYCMGFIDDNTMRMAMELSDVGMSPTLWEGFDLPLGEMQYLYRPMFVLDVGAHPEVVCDPYFLCKDIDDLGNKLVNTLQKGLPFSNEAFLQMCINFRKEFTWENCSNELLREMEKAIVTSFTVLIDVTNACHDTANSGVMRVTRTVSGYLQRKINTVFVLWDDSIGQYVLPYDEEVALLSEYSGPNAVEILNRSVSGQARTTLEEVFSSVKAKRMAHLFIETVNYKVLSRAIGYFHSKGIPVAAIFHDAIPVIRPDLCSRDVSENHEKYMLEISECDVVIPTALHNGEDLKRYWSDNGIDQSHVFSIELAAEMSGIARVRERIDHIDDSIRILFVSTLEPRKNHIRFLNGLELMFKRHTELEKRVTVHLVGNRYAGNEEIPKFVEQFCANHKNVKWLGVVDDENLHKEYRECTFTAYPSEIEGFGMPIIESLWFGKPCMCSNSGSIGELGSKGGCALTNVLSEDSISEELYRLISDNDYYTTLQHEACDRHITTWDEYTDEICETLLKLNPNITGYKTKRFPVDMKRLIKSYYNDCKEKKVVIVSNFYPPSFIGGAEIVAHEQAKALEREGIAKVIVFSTDTSGRELDGSLAADKYENIPVIRISTGSECFDQNSVNFFNDKVNDTFRELCDLIHPDIIHCHNIIGMSLGIVDIAHEYSAKVVVTLHDNWGFCYKNTMLDNYESLCKDVFACNNCKKTLTGNGISIPMNIRKTYFRRVFERIDGYISPSQYLADTYMRAGFDYHKLQVLWNGIDVKKYSNLNKHSSEMVRITVVAWFGKHKGIETLIKAVGELNRNDLELNLVGSGEEEDNYRKIATESGIFNKLKFWGRIPNENITCVYEKTDIYCLPSIWPENQPVSITEAMACGLPVVASHLGGNTELVQDGVSGFLFEAGNIHDLSEKLRVLVEDAELRNRMGEAGRRIIKQYTFDKQVLKLNELYDNISIDLHGYRNVIAVKGYILPNGFEHISNADVLVWDWVKAGKDLDDLIAVVVLTEERLNSDDMMLLENKNIKIFVPASDIKNYADGRIIIYESQLELILKLSEYTKSIGYV